MTTAPSADVITQAIGEVLPQARAAWLFGSGVGGSFHESSDLDIAVDLREPLYGVARWQLTTSLALRLGREVDLLDFRRLHTVMQFQVLSTGQLLFSRDMADTQSYGGFVRTEYQNIQTWRQPMIAALAKRLTQQGLHP